MNYLNSVGCTIFREINLLIQDMSPPGRFLRKNGNGIFEEVTRREAREKICQTLRDAVSETNAANTRGQSDVNDEDEDQSGADEDAIPIKEETIDGHYGHFNITPTEMLPLKVGSSRVSVSPDKIVSRNAPATVTPTTQTIENVASVTLSNISSNHTSSSDSIISGSNIGYNAYIHNDFDLFDGALLKSAKHDKIFSSMKFQE